MDDWQLLRQYAEQNSQEAFATLTRRYVNLVYSVCRRELSDPDLADDVTQAVFLILARKASGLRRGVILSGWLFQTARFAAKNARTREQRRRRHEQEAAQQAMIDQSIHENALWNGMEPFLNRALASLGTGDRDAALLRCLEGRSFPETGAALGVSEEAARKRVFRGLEKLRRILVKEGVIVSSAALAALLSARAVRAAPATCAPAVAQATLGVLAGQVNASLVGSHSYQISQGVLHAMKIVKMKMTAGAVALALAGTAVTYTVVRGESAPAKTPTVLAQKQAAPTPPQEVVARCKKAYDALQSYQGFTEVHTTGTMNGKTSQYDTLANIWFVRPGKIQAHGITMSGTPFTYVSDGTATYEKILGNTWNKVGSPEMAIASVTGIAMNAATTIPAALLHTNWGNPFPADAELSLTMPQEEVDGHACFHLTAARASGTSDYWIDAKTFLFRRIVTDSSGKGAVNPVRLQQDQRFTHEKLDAPIDARVFALPVGQ